MSDSPMRLAEAARQSGHEVSTLQNWIDRGWLRADGYPQTVTWEELSGATFTARWSPRKGWRYSDDEIRRGLHPGELHVRVEPSFRRGVLSFAAAIRLLASADEAS